MAETWAYTRNDSTNSQRDLSLAWEGGASIMEILGLLESAIGLVLVYLVLSLICSVWVRCLIPVLLLLVPLAGAAEQGGPVRVEVQSHQLEVPEGSDTPITVQLVDAGGTPVPAGKPFEIQVKVAMGDGASRTVPVTLQQGESAMEVMVQALGSGVLSVEATNDELLKGVTLLRVRPRSREESLMRVPSGLREELLIRVPPEAGDEVIERSSGAAFERRSPEVSDIVRPQPERDVDVTPPDRDDALTREVLAGDVNGVIESPGEPVIEDEVPAGPLPLLELRPFPDRSLRADGADPAMVFAFLHGESDHTDVTLTLWRSSGQLVPTELHIPNGQTTGEARLTSDLPGTVKVNLISTAPQQLEVTGEQTFEFVFHPPVDKLDISAPRVLEVGDSAELAVDLVNAAGTPVMTVELRKVRFQVLAGKVRIRDPASAIPAGDSGVRTELTADWWGDAQIEVSTPNLSKQRISVAIGLPWGLLAITAFGGMLGGLIAWTHGPEKRQHLVMRLLVGLVAGFVLYWLLAYLALPETSDVVRNVAVRNPFGAFGSSVVGGWLGTEVFDIAARWVGLVRTKT